MRSVLVAVLSVACNASPPAHPQPAATPRLDAYVIDGTGPVANAAVQVLALHPFACPCPATGRVQDPRDDDGWLPECTCPAAAATWRDALERCTRPAPLAVVHADERGHVLVPAMPHTTLVATGPGGERWLETPALRTPLALELDAPHPLRVSIAGSPAGLHAGIVFADGHCVPLVRDGAEWVPQQPTIVDDTSVVVAASPDGFAVRPVDRSSTTAELAIHAPRVLEGDCTGSTVARLEGPFEQLVTKVDPTGHFRFARASGRDADVQCLDDAGKVHEEYAYLAKDQLFGQSGRLVTPRDPCFTVEVVGPTGAPVAGAVVSVLTHAGNAGFGEGGGETDKAGRTCVSPYGNALEVSAPEARGGWCAARTTVPLTAAITRSPQPLRVVLPARELPRVAWRGRVVSPEHLPVAGALVEVDDLRPRDTPGCDERPSVRVRTALDGTFALPELPRGKLVLDISHDFYTERHDLEIDTSSPPRDLVLERGASWTGRVIDPDGHAIDHCTIFLDTPDGLKTAECTAAGFAFTVLPPGKTKVSVRLEHHPLGAWRELVQTITIAAHERHRADIRWPAGEPIAGVVVDAHGTPVPGARLTALPSGKKIFHTDRFDEDEVMIEADAAGRFELRHLRPGVWTITGDRRAPHQSSIDVPTGARDVRFVASH